MSLRQERAAGDPLTPRECVRVVVAMLAIALIGVWTRLETPAAMHDAEPSAFLRLARIADPGLTESVPPFAREPLPEALGAALVSEGRLRPTTAHNLLAILGGFAGGLALWGFLRGLCGRPLPAFTAAALVMVQPWRTTLVANPSIAWLLGPSLALAGVAWIARGGAWRAAVLAAAGWALCGWTSFAQLAVTLLGSALLFLASTPLMRRPFPAGEPVGIKRAAAAFGAALATAALLLAPAWLRGLPDEPPLRGESASGWLGADGAMQLFGVQWSAEGRHYYWPVMIGWLVFGALVWIALNVRDPRLRPWWLTLAGAFLLLQGTHLHVLGQELPQVLLPHAWLAQAPGFEQLPGPAAWLPLLGVAMAAVLALGLCEWQIQHGRAATFLIAAFTAMELRIEPQAEARSSPPAAYAQMARAEQGAVLELPLTPLNAAALWSSRGGHGRPIALEPLLAGGALAPLRAPPAGLLDFLLPDADGEGGTEDAARALAAVDPADLAAWRRWLEDDAQVRWAILRHAPDLGVRSPKPDHDGWLRRLKRELTPWSFNAWLHEERESVGRPLVGAMRAAADRSARARALLESWYGAPTSRLGSSSAIAWLCEPAPAATAVEAATERGEASVAAPAVAPR